MGLQEGLAEGLLEFWGEQGGLAWVLVAEVGHGLALVVAVEGVPDPAGGVAQGLGDFWDGVAGGEEPEGVPAGAFYGVLAFPVQGVKVIRVMLQLELQPGAALVFGEVHGPILRERTRGISYHFLDLLEDFREERLPLEAPLALLRSWALRAGEGYLEAQALFAPYPKALVDLRIS